MRLAVIGRGVLAAEDGAAVHLHAPVRHVGQDLRLQLLAAPLRLVAVVVAVVVLLGLPLAAATRDKRLLAGLVAEAVHARGRLGLDASILLVAFCMDEKHSF